MCKSKAVSLILIACIFIISFASCSQPPRSTTNTAVISTTAYSTTAPISATTPTQTTITITQPPPSTVTITIPTPTGTTTPSLNSLNVFFIDVGQGDSILIDQGQTEVLIDGGSQSPGVVTFLRKYVDGDLEVMVATHPHADHIGGLIAVLDAFKIDQIWHNGDTSTSATYLSWGGSGLKALRSA